MRIIKAKAWVLGLNTLESQLSWEKAPYVYTCCVAAWALCIVGFLNAMLPVWQTSNPLSSTSHVSSAAMCDGLVAAEAVRRSAASLQSDVVATMLSRC